jgi:hypothetical protein
MASHIVKVYSQLGRSLWLMIGCWLLLSVPASAQVGNAAKVRMQEMDKRELQLSDVARGNRKETDPRARAIMDQVSEDFQRLLKLHNEIVRAIASNDSPDYQFISDATGEIKKRATRLQSTLELHKPETPETQREMQDLETMQTKDDLIMLCRKIESFIKNPIIDTPGTVDAQQLEKARRDLESVVRVSGAIKKSADRQKKAR